MHACLELLGGSDLTAYQPTYVACAFKVKLIEQFPQLCYFQDLVDFISLIALIWCRLEEEHKPWNHIPDFRT